MAGCCTRQHGHKAALRHAIVACQDRITERHSTTKLCLRVDLHKTGDLQSASEAVDHGWVLYEAKWS